MLVKHRASRPSHARNIYQGANNTAHPCIQTSNTRGILSGMNTTCIQSAGPLYVIVESPRIPTFGYAGIYLDENTPCIQTFHILYMECRI